MSSKQQTAKRQPPTPEQIRAEQQRQAERDTAQIKANLPAAPAASTAVAVPDTRTAVQKYLDDIAPASIVGRLIKFNKEGQWITADDDAVISDEVDFIALCDQTLIGWLRFNGEGEPPDRITGLLYDSFIMPARETLGDDDQSKWETGLDGRPQDPWQHHVCVVLQRADTQELFTYDASAPTRRRAVGNLLRHYDRTQKTPATADTYPIIRLKIGGYQAKDDRIGWVTTPVFAVVGRAPKDSAAKPDTSVAADMSDEIPF